VLTPDGTRVVIQTQMGLTQRALHAVRLDGRQPPVLLHLGSAAAGVAVTDSTLVYAALPDTSRFLAVPLTGGTPILLNPAPYDLAAADFRLRPDGDELLFRAQPDGFGTIELFAVPLDASALPRRLNGPLIPAGDVDHYTLSPGGEGVVYRADRTVNEAFELSGVRIDGGPVVAYNPPFAPGPVVGDVQSFAVSPDGERVLYRADQDVDQAFRLSLARTDGRGEPRELTAGLAEASSAFTGYALSPDGTRAVFLFAESPGSASGDLYSVALDAPSAPLRIDDRSRVYAQALEVDAQSERVVYLHQRTLFDAFYELCSARLDGSGLALTLTPPSGNVSAYRLAPDGSAAIYLADHAAAGRVELHRVPLDGSAAALRLGAGLPATADVTAFAIAPDGLRVAFLADIDADEVVELWSVPADGSGPALKLSAAPVAGGDVTHLAITPDSAHVVYRADAVIDGTFELFRVPLAGGAVVPLTALPPGAAAQADFAVSPDSAHVLFRAYPGGASAFEFFRAPSDGSAAPVVLSGPMVAGGGVGQFELAADGARVAYRADQHVVGVLELHSVPLAGGPSTRLQQLPPTGDVTDFRIAPDSATVAWRADAGVNAVFDLFLAPLDGSGPPRRVSYPMPTGGDVQTDLHPLAGGRCVYRADQEENDVLQLYTGFLGHGPRPANPPTPPTRTVVR
jgi:Tol biopolymer transport system component